MKVCYSVVRTEGSMLECTEGCSASDVRGMVQVVDGDDWVSHCGQFHSADVSQGIYLGYWAGGVGSDTILTSQTE